MFKHTLREKKPAEAFFFIAPVKVEDSTLFFPVACIKWEPG